MKYVPLVYVRVETFAFPNWDSGDNISGMNSDSDGEANVLFCCFSKILFSWVFGVIWSCIWFWDPYFISIKEPIFVYISYFLWTTTVVSSYLCALACALFAVFDNSFTSGWAFAFLPVFFPSKSITENGFSTLFYCVLLQHNMPSRTWMTFYQW